MHKITITRTIYEQKQTRGFFEVFDNTGEKAYVGKILELPWLDNRRNVSCIPTGRYKAKKYKSPNNGDTFLLENVPGRSLIQIHAGNFYTDIRGCILPGMQFTDINKDGLLDVTLSQATMEVLYQLLPNEIEVEIINA